MAKPAFKKEPRGDGVTRGVSITTAPSPGQPVVPDRYSRGKIASYQGYNKAIPVKDALWSEDNPNARANITRVNFKNKQRVDFDEDGQVLANNPGKTIRKVVTTQSNQQNPPLHPTVDQDFNQQQYRKTPTLGARRRNNSASTDDGEILQSDLAEQNSQPHPRNRNGVLNKNQLKSASSGRAMKKNSVLIHMSLGSRLFLVYIFLQLPFAILNVASFGLLSALSAAKEALKISDDDAWYTMIWKTALDVTGQTFTALNNMISETTGIDVAEIAKMISPDAFFAMTWGVLIANAFIVFFLTFQFYQNAHVQSLSGKGSASKLTMCLLMFIGYLTPILNIFPWVIVWMLAVWFSRAK